MHKKAQSQIITTVLIILLVLAAIVIVWQVIQNMVKGTSDQIKEDSDCLLIDLTIEKAVAGTIIAAHCSDGTTDLNLCPNAIVPETTGPSDIIVRRGTEGPENLKIYAFKTGGNRVSGTVNVAPLEIQTFDFSVNPGDEIKAGVILEDGNDCDPKTSAVVTSA